MRIFNVAIALAALTAGVIALSATPASAQGTQFPDVPANHWAYQAVTDLANAGYVIGYPDAKFLGTRQMTRYEFATAIDRMVQTINQMNANIAKDQGTTGDLQNKLNQLVTPTGTPVTQDDLNKIQVLVDTFQPELTAIQSSIANINDQLDSLRQDVIDTKALARKAQATADASYGNASTRKYSITGYIQSRYVDVDNGKRSIYTQGLNNGANAGGISSAYNSAYAEGGTPSSIEVRRARMNFLGTPSNNLVYKIQFDVAGPVNNNSSNSQIAVLEAYGQYTFGNGSAKYPALTAGEFANPFGYVLPASSSAYLTPERPLAFNNTNNVSLWDSQDYDEGAKLTYGPGPVRFTYALLNGSGRQAQNIQNHFDSVARVAYASPTKIFSVGASYYGGNVARGRGTGNGDSAIAYTTTSYAEPKKQLYGFDAQATEKGFFADYEFVRGTYEKRSYFDQGLSTAGTNPLGFETDNYVKGNQVQGSYVWGGYTFDSATARPLTLAVDYDTFQRSMSSRNDSSDALQSSGAGGTYFKSGSSFDDVNFGYGALYNLDRATRLRLWYDRPFAVAHAPGTAEPPKSGLFTAEMQYKF